MARRVVYAYVYPYTDQRTRRAVVFCSTVCGINSLEEQPASWDTLRTQISYPLRDAITCYGCGLTINQANEDQVNDPRKRALPRPGARHP